jgi:hypothetical protein
MKIKIFFNFKYIFYSIKIDAANKNKEEYSNIKPITAELGAKKTDDNFSRKIR